MSNTFSAVNETEGMYDMKPDTYVFVPFLTMSSGQEIMWNHAYIYPDLARNRCFWFKRDYNIEGEKLELREMPLIDFIKKIRVNPCSLQSMCETPKILYKYALKWRDLI